MFLSVVLIFACWTWGALITALSVAFELINTHTSEIKEEAGLGVTEEATGEVLLWFV